MSTGTKVPPRPGSGAARRAKAAKHKTHRTARRNPVLIVAGLVMIVIVAFIVAVVGGGDGAGSPSTSDAVAQTRPVSVSGSPLAELQDAADDSAVGALAPTITGTTFTGVPVSLPASDRPTLTVFVAHWCPHCQKEVPLLTAWNAAGEVPAGVEVFAVSTGVDANAVNYPPSEWLEREEFPFGVLVDNDESDAAAAMGVSGYPFFVMTDADGTVLWRASGELPTDTLTQMIDDSLAA